MLVDLHDINESNSIISIGLGELIIYITLHIMSGIISGLFIKTRVP